MVLYPLRKTRRGRQRGEFPVGTLCWQAGELEIDCPDPDLRRRLVAHFSALVHVRVPRGGLESVLAYAWAELSPGSDPHYRECLRRLKQLDLVAVPED